MTRLERFESLFIPEPNSGCFLWIGATYCRDYGQFEQELAHRVAYEIYIGQIPPGLNVLHQCDVQPCVNPDHLYAGTHQQNMADAAARNRFRPLRGDDHPSRKHPETILRGARHGRALLTEEDVHAIRRSTEIGLRLADRYGVSSATIYAIKAGRNWRHLRQEPQS